MNEIEIPKQYYLTRYPRRKPGLLKGKSKCLDDSIRKWIQKNNGLIFWKTCSEPTEIDIFTGMDPISKSLICKTITVSANYNAWVAVFDTRENLLLFKLTWC